MVRYEATSTFRSLPIEIFIYPAIKKDTHRTLLLLKGLYGFHTPSFVQTMAHEKPSWDQSIIRDLNDDHNIICLNTARLHVSDSMKRDKAAFEGKTFAQECNDISLVVEVLNSHDLNLSELTIIANSFGGTTLLGVPDVLRQAKRVVMIASGCGKSLTSTRPLVASLYDEERLLESIRGYRGHFAYVRGDGDSVVPKESQDKVIKNAVNCRTKTEIVIKNAQHDLSPVDNSQPTTDAFFLLSSLVRWMNETS